ncbi:MAG: 4Fe-4S dicluster domain-containing protein [Methanomassiliicoccales archaeon]|nr:4Fe-4S dicluster domain-containing protein [Methanomassiliicoccales archaeon]NYT14384.1 4Fe-4S dicluster domain-containing protein [Methanomassiliicoccales archaeon]
MKRSIISIDEDLCDGCGQCADACPEGAIQIIDGKARLVSGIFCDGLGACIGDCPTGAISIKEREAEVYDERRVMENIIKKGEGTIRAHLKHLKDHGETGYLKEALEFLEEKGIDVDFEGLKKPQAKIPMVSSEFPGGGKASSLIVTEGSELSHWPVQMHLISPTAPQYRDADLVLAADCVAFASGRFHQDFLKGKSLAIACPKLDSGLDRYLEKLVSLIDEARVRTITVVTMEVPCCQGLTRLVKEAIGRAERKVPLELVVISTAGEVLKREWINLS